jgi:hypothetical protein
LRKYAWNVTSKHQVDTEAGGSKNPKVGRMLGLIHTCCGVWDGKLHHVRGDRAELLTST